MQWGGQRFLNPNGSRSAFALGSFSQQSPSGSRLKSSAIGAPATTNTGGKLGHFAIGWKACDDLSGTIGTLMKLNQPRIGFGDEVLNKGSEFHMGRGDFVPLADVPDYIWVNSRPDEPIQHFADIDIHDINGKKPLLDQCLEDPSKLSAKVWKMYFDGFAAASVGPDDGALPLRVWQLWEAMKAFVKARDLIHFVAAAGVLAHYVGDASQPLHCSYLHHGIPPMLTVKGRKYPVQKDSAEFKDYKKTREYKIHAIYEETMIEVDTPTVLSSVDQYLKTAVRPKRTIKNGHDAANETVKLMGLAQKRLPPRTIINADDPSLAQEARAALLWKNKNVRKQTIASLGDSVILLSDLWTSAWKAGGGPSIKKTNLVEFSEPDLEAITRDKKFVESMSLAEMANSGLFEP